MPPGGSFSVEIVEERPGLTILRVTGRFASETFGEEAGGHRWQRIPPTERRGRVHTSTVTVAVLPEPTPLQLKIAESDLEWATCRGSGAGGQHRNKTESAVVLKHVPTGVTVRCESERSQRQNRETALGLLRARIWEARQEEAATKRDAKRRQQVGSGMRGDKRRTVAVQRDEVVDHVTGQRWQFKAYARGDW